MIYLIKIFFKRIFYKYFFPKNKYEETSLGIQLVKNFHQIESITASFKYQGGEIFFNPKRIYSSELLTIINEIGIKDNFLLNSLPKENSTIIDIGTYIGLLPVVANYKLNKAKIYCVEPDIDNFKFAKKNIDQLPTTSNEFVLMDCAIGTKNQRQKLYLSEKLDWRSTILEKKEFLDKIDDNYKASYDVDVWTLEMLLSHIPEKVIDLCKMTIAGEIEAEVLESSSESILSKDIRIFSLLTYPVNSYRVRKFFKEIGYYEKNISRDGTS